MKSEYKMPFLHKDNEEANLREIIGKYLRHWKVFAGTFIAGLVIAFIANQYTAPVFKVESKLLVNEEGSAVNLFDIGSIAGKEILPKGQKMANDMIILKSRSVAQAALDQIPLDVEYYEDGLFIPRELYKTNPVVVEADWAHNQLTSGYMKIEWTDDHTYTLQLQSRSFLQFNPSEPARIEVERPFVSKSNIPFGEWFETESLKIRVYYTGKAKQSNILIRLRDNESLLAQYTGEELQILPIDKTSSILSLTLQTSQPEKGRDYLNALMNVFLERELNDKNSLSRNTIRFIDSQLTGISDSLNRAEHKLERFRSSHRTYDISTEGNTIFEKLSELEKSLSEERFKKKYYQNLNDYLANEEYSQIIAPSGIGIDDNVLNKMIGDLIVLQAENSRYRATQTENSPAVKEANRKLQDLTQSIKEVLKNVDRNTELLIQDLQGRIGKIEAQFGSLPQTEQQLLNIKRKYSLNESIYTYLLQKRAESAITLASNTPSNKIIEEAVLNFEALRLKPILNYFLAAFLAIVVPFAAITLIGLFSVKITDISEVEQKLAVPLLGTISQNTNGKSVLASLDSRSALSESFRALRTNINFLVPRSKHVSIMVTSTIAGEGKTFCSMNIASVYSMSGKKTLVICCDLRKTFRFENLELENEAGLSSYLSGQSNDVNKLICHDASIGFDILPPGPIPPNPSELLVSEAFEAMLEQLKVTYDVIVLDSSPVGITTETLHLTKLVDFTIFVLRQNYSEKTFIDDVNALKEKKSVKNIYAVVNDVEKKYRKYGGYGYGYFDEDSRKKSAKQTMASALTNKAAL